MGIDLDSLDDIFAVGAVNNARPTGKFQPKAKLRTRRNDSTPTLISSSSATLINAVESELSEPATTAKPSEHNDQQNYESVSFLDQKVANSTVSLQSGLDVVPNDSGGWHSCMGKSVGENADIFIGLDSLDDFIPHTASDIEGTIPPQETVIIPNSHNGEWGLAIPVLSSVDDSNQSKTTDAPSFPLSVGEPTVSSGDGVGHMDNGVTETNEMNVMDMGNLSELITRSDKRTGKFHPKPKMKMQEMCRGRFEAVSSPFCPQQVSPEINFANKEPLPAFDQEDVLDLSSIGFTPAIPADATSELPVTDGSMNLKETNQLVSGIHLDSMPKIPAKLASRRAKARKNDDPTASDSSQPQENAFTSTRENETGRSLRPRKPPKTNICELADESEDEILAGWVSSDECLGSSVLEEGNINNEEYQEDSEFLTKKVKRKSKKQDGDGEKTARKRKISKGASQQDADAKPKKFSHSTRRRKLDKVLLETPEDDIDYQKVPLRDLILLAEHKERQMKKEESVAGAPSTKPSHDNSSEFFNEDDDVHLSPRVEESSICFNYQTYMDRTPIARWSKQDTELFYEGVRQFGTDLSLIQQLFPGRTRRQVKLKYKKEERQQPLRLRDALTNRSKDHSHFEAVIVRLQQIAAEEKENADKNGSTELGDNDVADEGVHDASDDEEAKNEQQQQQQMEGQKEEEGVGQDLAEDGSPLKLYDSEDDLFRWSQYKSDT
ncbi:uncharacterized protein [Primulina huaijiensis]|uniref:uncharacterized protein isoform X2 n=1 Tax=Primulina huaijiensis TaxID=1492673 RepID=UPI003CC742C5